ncbi:hypothetical protein B0H16DRAFT_1487484, partial [Mycena metata]
MEWWCLVVRQARKRCRGGSGICNDWLPTAADHASFFRGGSASPSTLIHVLSSSDNETGYRFQSVFLGSNCITNGPRTLVLGIYLVIAEFCPPRQMPGRNILLDNCLGVAPFHRDARKLTDEEVLVLGVAIQARVKQLESWFRYQRKKIRATDNKAETGSSAALRTLFGMHGAKRTRVHKAIEVFQMRNPELIKDALTEAGYDNITTADDTPDDFTDEAAGTPEAAKKSR